MPTNTINFGVMGEVFTLFDSDRLYIKRNGILLNNPIACNITINRMDAPNSTSIDLIPVETSLSIHMPNRIDIRNHDYIIAQKLTHDKKVIKQYQGFCGEPAVYSSERQTVDMQMKTAGGEIGEPIEPPPDNPSAITILCKDFAGINIREPEQRQVPQNEPVTFEPPSIEGYSPEESYLDGVYVSARAVTIPDPTPQGHEVKFVYEQSLLPVYFRILLNGLYTQDNSDPTFGLHLFKKIPFFIVSDGVFATEAKEFFHPDMAKMIKLNVGTKIKVYTTGDWYTLSSAPIEYQSGFKFEVLPYTPTQAEQLAYETHWYDE